MGNPFDGFSILILIAFAMIPFGLWKLIEIIVWLSTHNDKETKDE